MKVIVEFEETLIGDEVYATGYGYELAGYFTVSNKLWDALKFFFEWSHIKSGYLIYYENEEPIEIADMICPEPKFPDRICIKNKYYESVRKMFKHLQKIGAIVNW